VKNLGNLLKAA